MQTIDIVDSPQHMRIACLCLSMLGTSEVYNRDIRAFFVIFRKLYNLSDTLRRINQIQYIR